MTRDQGLEDILAAWYRFDTAPLRDKAKAKASFDSLVQRRLALSGGQVTRYALLECIKPAYDDYRRAQASKRTALPKRA